MAHESTLRLTDKTIVISAPFTGLTCSILTTLTGYGADCALICRETADAQRFCLNLADTREINPSHGRCAAFAADIADPRQAEDAISKCAETFGGVDVFVDSHLSFVSSLFREFDIVSQSEALIKQSLFSTLVTTRAALKFLEGRTRGRLIYLGYNEQLMSLSGEAFNSLVRSGVGSFVKALAKELETISVHWLTVGLTEEFLLQRYPKSPSIKLALEELRKVLPGIKIQDPSDIANAVAFLSSPLSAAIC